MKGITFIICAGNLTRAENCRLSIERSIDGGSAHEFIVIDNRKGQYDLFSAYAKGAEEANLDILAFVHDDVEVLSSSYWLDELRRHTDKEETGIVGVAGSLDLTAGGVWWERGHRLSGCAVHTDGKSEWMTAFGPFGRVAIVDGLLFFIKRRVFQAIGGFSDTALAGFHFYDIDLSARAHWAGYENYTINLIVKHLSIGETGAEWEKSRRLWVQANRDRLPIHL